ncbi:MAG: iron ABC transporter permease [Roseococcus sp.]|nr:iron ABC transporter permease [Roseococcus sp.]
MDGGLTVTPVLARPAAPRVAPILLLGGLLLLACLLAGVLLGPARVTPAGLLATLADLLGWAPLDVAYARDAAILGVVRAPRVLLAAVLGAGLAMAGAVMQGLFRNPLADPGLIGVSAGAALAAVGAIVLGPALFGARSGALGLWLLPLAAFGGGLAATLLIARLATRDGVTGVALLLLAGVAVNALCGALTGLLVFMADDRQVRDITFWSLGSLAGARWVQLPVAALLVLLPALAMLPLARALNAVSLGEREAFHLGLRVESAKRLAVTLAAVAVSAGVALAGLIGFVGLVVPHLVRLMVGADHRLLLPGAALLGASLMVLADLAARSLAAPAELPVGVVTALIGAPFFLWLLRHRAGGA